MVLQPKDRTRWHADLTQGYGVHIADGVFAAPF
jgi:hypothetical protein